MALVDVMFDMLRYVRAHANDGSCVGYHPRVLVVAKQFWIQYVLGSPIHQSFGMHPAALLVLNCNLLVQSRALVAPTLQTSLRFTCQYCGKALTLSWFW